MGSMKMQKYKIKTNKPPVSDIYFEVDIEPSLTTQKHKVVLCDKQKFKIVDMFDFTFWFVRIFDNIKKFVNKLLFNILHGKQQQTNTTINQQKTEICRKHTKS